MKKLFKRFLIIVCILVSGFGFASCKEPGPDQPEEFQEVDYVSELKLDMNSETLKQEVTVKSFIDGDTTHFYVPKSVRDTGILKARYLAINTPESTGKIEEWGKAASNFTKEKLSNAVSIIIESDNNQWNLDSTGDRHLVWVWYKTSESDDYRNLNLEILQTGLAIASNSSDNRYGTYCMKAISQAKKMKLYVYSGEKDPNYPYGEATAITLKELRCNIEEYEGQKVSFEGVVVRSYNSTIYVENYDEETGLNYGISIYYGFNLSGKGLEIIEVGNFIKVVGTVQYYEEGQTYQVSGVQYFPFKPNDPDNLQLISKDNEITYAEITANDFVNGKVSVSLSDEETKEFDYPSLIMNTLVSMDNLKVKSVYTTDDEDSSSKGAMTLTCEVDGLTISIRTIVLEDENGNLITSETFEGKTIDVKGMVDYFKGSYQIKVFSMKDITIH